MATTHLLSVSMDLLILDFYVNGITKQVAFALGFFYLELGFHGLATL